MTETKTIPGIHPQPDGTVRLVLPTGTTLNLRPLTLRENREMRERRHAVQDWAQEQLAERDALDAGDKTTTAAIKRAKGREIVEEIERRNLEFARHLIGTVADGPLPDDDGDLPPWLAFTVDLAELQALLANRPPAGGELGRR